MTSLSIFMTSCREKLPLMLTKVFRFLASPRRWDLRHIGQAEANSLPFVACLVLSLLKTETSPYARQYRLDHQERLNITNLERARTAKYPSFFYTYSPQAMLDRLFWQSTELARLESFGQKLAGSKDLFDRTADKINADMSLGDGKKQHAFDAIGALRRTVYGQNKRGWGIRLLRGASSAGLAGSPHTSSKIGLSMLFNVPAYRGLARTLMRIANHAFNHAQSVEEL